MEKNIWIHNDDLQFTYRYMKRKGYQEIEIENFIDHVVSSKKDLCHDCHEDMALQRMIQLLALYDLTTLPQIRAICEFFKRNNRKNSLSLFERLSLVCELGVAGYTAEEQITALAQIISSPLEFCLIQEIRKKGIQDPIYFHLLKNVFVDESVFRMALEEKKICIRRLLILPLVRVRWIVEFCRGLSAQSKLRAINELSWWHDGQLEKLQIYADLICLNPSLRAMNSFEQRLRACSQLTILTLSLHEDKIREILCFSEKINTYKDDIV